MFNRHLIKAWDKASTCNISETSVLSWAKHAQIRLLYFENNTNNKCLKNKNTAKQNKGPAPPIPPPTQVQAAGPEGWSPKAGSVCLGLCFNGRVCVWESTSLHLSAHMSLNGNANLNLCVYMCLCACIYLCMLVCLCNVIWCNVLGQ